MNILILNGPNLNMTGKRNPDIYGTQSLDEIVSHLRTYSKTLDIFIEHVQSNYEGKLIDALQTAATRFDGVLLNAGALTHYSYALRDAISACSIPVGEVHMSNILKREAFRAIDVIEDVCVFRVMGLGAESYKTALKKMMDLIFLETTAP